MEEALQLISSPSGWVLYFVCAMLIGMSKTGIQNVGTLAVPLFAFLFGARYSTGIVLILLCFADLIAVVYYRKAFLWMEVKKLLPPSFAGIGIGLFLCGCLHDLVFTVLIGDCFTVGMDIMFWVEIASLDLQDWLFGNRWYAPIFGLIIGFSSM